MGRPRRRRRVVVIGGGTGTSIVLSGLKAYPLELTAIVPVTDDGGSTGRLRDEFGFLPVGDMRQCLAALADKDDLLRQILLYRFSKGKGLKGHNLGNLILTALEDMMGSAPKALIAAAEILKLKGRVLPISLQLVKLAAEYQSGKTIVSEHRIETHRLKEGDRIVRLYTVPKARINPEAKEAILKADLIVLGPGDLFNSTIANLVIEGTKEALKRSRAKLVYIVNLMTLNSQTSGMTAKDHVRTIETYAGRRVSWIVVNSQPIPQKVLEAYQKEEEYPVVDDLGTSRRIVRRPLLAERLFKKPKSDPLKRSLLRHDPQKLGRVLVGLLR